MNGCLLNMKKVNSGVLQRLVSGPFDVDQCLKSWEYKGVCKFVEDTKLVKAVKCKQDRKKQEKHYRLKYIILKGTRCMGTYDMERERAGGESRHIQFWTFINGDINY